MTDYDLTDAEGQLFENEGQRLCAEHGLPLDDGFCDACHVENGD